MITRDKNFFENYTVAIASSLRSFLRTIKIVREKKVQKEKKTHSARWWNGLFSMREYAGATWKDRDDTQRNIISLSPYTVGSYWIQGLCPGGSWTGEGRERRAAPRWARTRREHGRVEGRGGTMASLSKDAEANGMRTLLSRPGVRSLIFPCLLLRRASFLRLRRSFFLSRRVALFNSSRWCSFPRTSFYLSLSFSLVVRTAMHPPRIIICIFFFPPCFFIPFFSLFSLSLYPGRALRFLLIFLILSAQFCSRVVNFSWLLLQLTMRQMFNIDFIAFHEKLLD